MDLSQVKELLQRNENFSSCSLSIIYRIASKSSVLFYQEGDTIIRAGESSDSLYIIIDGKARAVFYAKDLKPITLANLSKDDTFGEHALLSKELSEITIRASTDLTLLKVEKVDFDWIISQSFVLRQNLESKVKQQEQLKFLRSLKFFASLTLVESQKLLQKIEIVSFRQGEFLYYEGTQPNTLYIIYSGSVHLIKQNIENSISRPERTLIAVLMSFEICGEDVLSNSVSYTTGAIAAEDTVVWCLKRDVFNQTSLNTYFYQSINQLIKNRSLQQKAILASYNQHLKLQHFVPFQFKKVRLGSGIHTCHYPFIQVNDSAYAGLACLAIIDYIFHRGNKLQTYLEQWNSPNLPDTLMTISHKAELQGYSTRLLYLSDLQLKQMNFPAIVQLEYQQLVVVLASTHEFITLANPLIGIFEISINQFLDSWDGRLLSINRLPSLNITSKRVYQVYKQTLIFLRPFGVLIFWIGIFTILMQLLGLVAPLFAQITIDKVLSYQDYSLLHLILLGMLFVAGSQLGCSALREILLAHCLKRVSLILSLQLFKHILSLPVQVYSKWRVGDFTIRLAESEKLFDFASQSGFRVVINSITILLYFFILYNLSDKLAGVTFLFVVLHGLILLFSAPILRYVEKYIFKSNQAVESHLIESISSIETIKTIAAENLFIQRGITLIKESLKAEFDGALLSFNIGLITTFISQVSIIVILGYGANLVLIGHLTTGQLVAFNIMLGLLLAPLQDLISVWDQMQELFISYQRITDILILPTEQNNFSTVTPRIIGHIKLEKICFCYETSKQDVISDVSLEIMPGQKIAVVGKSGSGKTTLAKLLSRLLQPTSGRILVDGIDIANIEVSSYRQQLGVVEQLPFLFSGTIRENIAKADPTSNLERVISVAKLAGAHDFIEQLPMGYDTKIGERGVTLSGGQQQRLAIARALLINPRILIFDEPTASLDSESERIIQQSLDQQISGRTTFIFAHRLNTVRNADMILVLEQGKVAEWGTHKQLLSQQGIYADLYSK